MQSFFPQAKKFDQLSQNNKETQQLVLQYLIHNCSFAITSIIILSSMLLLQQFSIKCTAPSQLPNLLWSLKSQSTPGLIEPENQTLGDKK